MNMLTSLVSVLHARCYNRLLRLSLHWGRVFGRKKSKLTQAMEGRMLAVLKRYSRRPHDFVVTGRQRLDPLDENHATHKITLESRGRLPEGPSPGDMAYLLWRNRPALVETLVQTLGFDPASRVVFQVSPSLYQAFLPKEKTLGEVLSVDLDCEVASTGLLRWAGLDAEAQHNQDQDLAHEVYHARLWKTRDWFLPHPPYKPHTFSVLSVINHGLSRGRSISRPQDLVDLLSPLGGRAYTLGGFSHFPGGRISFDLTVSSMMLELRSPDGSRALVPGRASNYISTLGIGDQVEGWVLPDAHNLKGLVDQGLPCLVICTGSGISGLLTLLRTQVPLPKLRLYYGVRSWETKALYGPELEAYRRSGVLESLDVAESRPLGGKSSQRVQDRLWENRGHVADMLREGWGIFICGGQAMGNAVRETLAKILLDQGLVSSDQEAEATLRAWELNQRYQASVSGVS